MSPSEINSTCPSIFGLNSKQKRKIGWILFFGPLCIWTNPLAFIDMVCFEFLQLLPKFRRHDRTLNHENTPFLPLTISTFHVSHFPPRDPLFRGWFNGLVRMNDKRHASNPPLLPRGDREQPRAVSLLRREL